MASSTSTESPTVKRKIPSLGFKPKSKNHKRTISISPEMDRSVAHYIRQLNSVGLDINYSQFVRWLLENELENKMLYDAVGFDKLHGTDDVVKVKAHKVKAHTRRRPNDPTLWEDYRR